MLKPIGMPGFKIVWWLATVVCLVPCFFFAVEIVNRPLAWSSYHFWLMLFAVIALLLYSSRSLYSRHKTRLAWVMLGILVLPLVVCLAVVIYFSFVPLHWQ